jgi:hypothetical protein
MDSPENIPQAVAEIRYEAALAAIDVAWRRLELAQERLRPVKGVRYELHRLEKLQRQVQLAMNDLMGRRDQLREQGGLSLDEPAGERS